MSRSVHWMAVDVARTRLPEVIDQNWVSYQLGIQVAESVNVQVGRMGAFEFPAGYYVYTGSARRNFARRVERHLAEDKTLRWHIDYLLAAPRVTIVALAFSPTDECQLNQGLTGQVWPKGFGASDCRSRCGAHLKRVRPDCFS